MLLDYSLTIGNYDAREFFAPHPINIFLIPSSRPGQAAIWIRYQTAASLFNYSLCNRDGTRICDWESVRDGLRLYDIGHAAARFTFLFFFLVKRETYSLCIQKHDTTFFFILISQTNVTRELWAFIVVSFAWSIETNQCRYQTKKHLKGNEQGRGDGGGEDQLIERSMRWGRSPFVVGTRLFQRPFFPTGSSWPPSVIRGLLSTFCREIVKNKQCNRV